MKPAFVIAIFLILTGCCWFAKRECYPKCDPTPPKIIQLEKPCTLPPDLVLEPIKRIQCPKEISDWICFTPEEAGKLVLRIADMTDWILEAQKRCGAKPGNTPSKPAK